MATAIALTVKARGAKTPKGELKTQRSAGMIPAVVYGGKGAAMSLWVGRRQLETSMRQAHSVNVLFNLTLDGKAPETVLLKSIQKDILYSYPVHVDFFRVDTTHKVDVPVHVKLEGEAKGVKIQGGILEHLLREVEVRCLPTSIPEAIMVNVTDLEIGHGILVKDLKVPEDVEMLTEGNHVVVNIIVPAREEEAAAAATPGAAAAEPEVIATKGKKEVEGAAPGAGAPAKGAAPAGGAPAKGGSAPGAKA